MRCKGVDDVLALFLLLASPEVHLAAITIVFGNTELDKAHTNIFKVYQIIHKHLEAHPEDARRFPNLKNRPILAKGAAGPLKGALNLAEYFHGPDGLSDVGHTHPEYNVDPALWAEDNPYLDVSSKPAEDVILETLEREPTGTVMILACGPLTNISKAISKAPSTFSRVKRLVVMGGALDVPGNTSPSAEFNFFADPWAAAHIIEEAQKEGAFKFVLAPLDVTGKHSVPFDRLIPDKPTSEATLAEEFLSTLLRRPRKFYQKLGLPDAFEMHDPLAAWYLLRTSGDTSEAGWGTVKRKFVIERIGEYTKGMCIVDRRGTDEELGVTRAVDGVILEGEDPSHHQGDHEGVHVIARWPHSKIFIEEMMQRVFWYSES